jgi:mycothiol system anti-sigma-R factor
VNLMSDPASCSQVLESLTLYLDAECDARLKNSIQTHLEVCGDCLSEYGIEREVKTLIARSCGGEAAPDELKVRLRERLEEIAAAPGA